MFQKVFRKIFLFLFLFIGLTATLIAQDSNGNGVRISLLTCGPGLDLYSGFGHSGIRIIDSTLPRDVVYNYGTFDFGDPDFYTKFTRGKLLYYVNRESFREFIYTYQVEARSVYEQVLDLNPQQQTKLIRFLDSNAQEENKYYKYDFLYDNCSTRILDIFKNAFPNNFKAGKSITADSATFRNFTNHYLRNNHWTRTGINLLMSTPVDKKMSNEQAMFLPDYLMEGFREAQIDGHPIVAQTIQILPSKLDFKQTRNTPRIVFWVFAIFIFLFSFSQPHRMVYFDTFFFLVIGLLGGFMLFMWFGTDHQSCSWNRNLLWALPAHLIFAFAIPRKASWIQQYARIAIGLILFGLVWNLFAAQVYIVEITPIVLLLLWRLNHYRRDPAKAQLYANVRTIFSKIR